MIRKRKLKVEGGVLQVGQVALKHIFAEDGG